MHTRHVRTAVAAIVSVTLSSMACGGNAPANPPAPAAARADWQPAFAPGGLDTADGSSGPQMTVSPRGLLLSWIEQQDSKATLRLAERGADSSWTRPTTVASGTDWFVSEVDVPSAIRLSDGTLVAQWPKAVDFALEAYDTYMVRSTDDGRTWSPPTTPHHDGTRRQHGFVSLFEWPARVGGGLGLVWLDGRAMTVGPEGRVGGDMSLFAARFGPDGKQTSESPVDRRVCECCPTSVASTPTGPIAAFRDRSDTDVRDIHVSRFEGAAWAPPTTVHADGWALDSCPVNGPAVAADGVRVAVAWWAAPGDDGHAFVAFSSDEGRSFQPPIRVDDRASLGHLGVALLEDGSAVVSWLEFDDAALWKVRRVESNGGRSPARTIAGGNGRYVSGIPRMARVDRSLIFAWTESRGAEPGASQRVMTATTPVPPPR